MVTLYMYGGSEGLLRRVQSVQNAAARLLTGARRRDQITPILRQMHWLPVRQRIHFKFVVLIFQCISVIADISMRRLRSTDTAMCAVRRSHNTFHDRCFATAGPSVPSRRRISGSAEFWPAAENPRKKYGRRKRRRNLESRSAAEKIRLNSAQYRPIPEMYETGSASLVLICCFRP